MLKGLVKAIKKYYDLNYEPCTMVGGSFRDGYKACMKDIEKLSTGESLETNDGTRIKLQFRVR